MTPPGAISPRRIPMVNSEAALLGNNCKDEACMGQQIQVGVRLLEQGNTHAAQDIFRDTVDCAEESKNIRYELLAKALIHLSEGRILAAQSNLQAIYDNPYAQRLLQVISQYDHKEVKLQTLHLLHQILQEEQSATPEASELKKVGEFLEESMRLYSLENKSSLQNIFYRLENDPSKKFSGMTQAIRQLAEGLGGRILDTSLLTNRERCKSLFHLLTTELLPQKRIGSAYLVAKMFQKDPDYGAQAHQYIQNFEAITQEAPWISTDFLDQGASYFAVSLLALAAGRWASRGVWHFLTRDIERLSIRRALGSAALSLGVSSATYFLSEKTLLGLTGFDGKIWPASGSELARELGADLIVMGLSNAMGGAFTWASDRAFAPISSRFSRMFRYTAYTLRSPLRLAAWGTTATFHSMVLYGTHRWQDNIGMVERFRPGKALELLPDEWLEIERNGFSVLRAQNILAQYRRESSTQMQNIKSDEIYHEIHELKRWIRSLYKGKQNPDEEKLLGLFWMARSCGKLNDAVQGHFSNWMRDNRFDRLNIYLQSQQIPLEVSDQGELIILPNDSSKP